ncbi:DUF3000 domain-containing protein [Nocardioides sp. TRM66260-LWL]|uniref:DUF3000 domain-containing protein n=1 Tax=Nocardioides sp. TRM66260-LWL TaxID=2874478 RepID=UPI001CC37466|nr:DUF3000 domain-containing protein [Nocardioides sp. TRM66260-LWL]MBZ5734423.1 DUF3000 domain-containing protein [Nocardioides sp. TRM66260-LWL]
MVVGPQTRPEGAAEPSAFREAVASLAAARLRPEVLCEEMPAPTRIAPHAAALSADVTVDGVDVGTGRLVVLHDPAGNDAWDGTFRCVAYVRADTEPETESDEAQLFCAAAWSWLTDALEDAGASHVAISGTVTRVVTESFGAMTGEPPTAQVELRASWTPAVDDDAPVDLRAHVEAWGEVLCAAAGLPPVPEGVAVLPSRRGQRGL